MERPSWGKSPVLSHSWRGAADHWAAPTPYVDDEVDLGQGQSVVLQALLPQYAGNGSASILETNDQA